MLGLAILEKIGMDLDEGVYPDVHGGGIVEPDQSHGRLLESGEERFYGKERSRRSTAGSRQGTARGSWPPGGSPTGGSGATSATTSLFSEQELSDAMVADLEGVIGVYPGVQFRFTPDLVWLINYIKPIRGLNETALLLTAYPHNPKEFIRSWAWWGPGVIWIGPRHTNYPDGGICSFEPTDPDAWHRGESLRDLLDFHVLWIVRHLFLRYFSRWPGSQVFHTEHERLTEHRPGELCGGCRSGLRYEDCCRSRDEKIDSVERVISFIRKFGSSQRNPPKAVSEFVYGYRRTPPPLSELNV